MIRRVFPLLLAALAACTRVGTSPETPPSPRTGETAGGPAAPAVEQYGGLLVLSERRLAVTLEVRGSGADGASALLRIPELEVQAQGSARRDGDRLELRLDYGGDCPGAMTVLLQGEGPRRLAGSLRARDCTGEASGPVSLERRLPPSGGVPRVELGSAGG